MKKRTALLIAGACLLMSSGIAFAQSAIVFSRVNIRSGPGTTYPVLGQLPQGVTVQVLSCTPTWCAINWGQPGYVAASFLGFDGPPPYVAGPPGPPVYVAPPTRAYGFGLGYYNPGPPVGSYLGAGAGVWTW